MAREFAAAVQGVSETCDSEAGADTPAVVAAGAVATGEAGTADGHPGGFEVCDGLAAGVGAGAGSDVGACKGSGVAVAGAAVGAALDVGIAQPDTEGPLG